ncbi:MAG: exodeoxyribonuclease I [Pseudomonadota bacterium]
MTAQSFLWHDYETFGADPRRDRPCQFAALRTDLELKPIEQPVIYYSQPTMDLLPVPDACLVTGITPQEALEKGLPEYEFARAIERLMSLPGTCTVGYNNFRFDDEVTRFMFWRNFIEPYAREYSNGNSRFDLIDLLRLTCALRPDGIEWPLRDDGAPSFRLEDLAKANGMEIEHAHDALADVENTIGMARLVKRHQPRLWDWALSLRERFRVEKLLQSGKPLLHATSRFGADQFCIAPVLPLFQHTQIASQWLVWNLRESPAEFRDFDAETLEDLHFTPARDLPEGQRRLPVKWVRSNRCPMLAPMNVVNDTARERTGIDPETAAHYAEKLHSDQEFIDRLRQVFRPQPGRENPDAETALYAGFVSRDDRQICARLNRMSAEQIADFSLDQPEPFADRRLNTLLLHFTGRHAETRLDEETRMQWQDYRHRRLLHDPDLASIQLEPYRQRITELMQQYPDKQLLLEALAHWPETLQITDESQIE